MTGGWIDGQMEEEYGNKYIPCYADAKKKEEKGHRDTNVLLNKNLYQYSLEFDESINSNAWLE